MPRLNTNEMDVKNIPNGNFGYSFVRMENLGACEYTLVTIVQDVSGSVDGYKKKMEDCLSQIVTACAKSPRADNLMIRFVQFGSTIEEVHGFKLLADCNPADYQGVIKINGMTALYDAAENGVKAMAAYGEELLENDFNANGILFIITDGGDNASTNTMHSVKKVLAETIRNEVLESLVTILVGVGTGDVPGVTTTLKKFKEKAGLSQYIELKKADSKSLAGLAAFVSQSISLQSNALGTGANPQPVQALTF